MTSFAVTVLALGVLGLFVGSFLGTLVVRLTDGQPVGLARSVCPVCGHRLGPLELVPLASWLIQSGRCRACRAPIPIFYPAMEIAGAAVAVWAAVVTTGIPLVLSLGLGWCLLALAAMDIRTFRLSDALTLPLLGCGLLAGWSIDREQFGAHLVGGASGFLVLFGARIAYRAVRHREGLGLGDAKLLAAGGAWVGWRGLAPIVLIASVAALVVVVLASFSGRRVKADTRLPFGAFLALGIWLVWLYAPSIP